MHFQDPSLLQFQQRMQEDQHQNNLRTLFDVSNIPKETQMREIIDSIGSGHFRAIFKDLYSRLQRSKYLEQYPIFPGIYYFPIDGSPFHSSKEVHCEQCLVKCHKSENPTYSHHVLQLAFNFYLLTLLAFLFHQIAELTDKQYQACRKKFGSKKHLWEKLRSWIDIIIFETWERLLELALAPKKGLLQWANPP